MENGDSRHTAYELLQLMSSLNETKRAILMALSHVFPKSVSGVQLCRLIGYSGKSRSLYRGILAHLEEDKLIMIDHLTPRLYAIRINNEHPLLALLVRMCREFGDSARATYLSVLEDDY
ncbi:MAG: hypothetical protein HXY34_05020 [Candidatus Thorarchaeota archaeon]|nr:hypothetical protein [Candidatus Thorarchaeota archaeon]